MNVLGFTLAMVLSVVFVLVGLSASSVFVVMLGGIALVVAVLAAFDKKESKE